MRTCPVSFETIADWEALRGAWRAYRSGKRRRHEVAAFELLADHKLLQLARVLRRGLYGHGHYRMLQIRDPKPRLIAVAPVRDRIVHTAVYRALGPWFNRGYIEASYACIEGRGQHRALWHFLDHLRRYALVMHLDIRCYYPSVDHQILRQDLVSRIRDPRIVALLDKILASGWELYQRPQVREFFQLPLLNGSLGSEIRAQGLPIGNLTSQWWGNLYLNPLDHFIKRELKVKGYLRYMDDMVLFGQSREQCSRWRRIIGEWLWQQRRLSLNPRAGKIRSCRQAQHYLGYRITRAGYDLGPKAIRRFKQRLPGLANVSEDKLLRSLWGFRGAVDP